MTSLAGRRIVRAGGVAEIGGKAAALSALGSAGMPIPPWFAVRAGSDAVIDDELAQELAHAVRLLSPDGELLAVRSSAVEEDGAAHSFAGQFESYLFVAPDDVGARMMDVWSGATSDRVTAYRRERGLLGRPPLPAVLVQRMVDPEVAGVAFSADPVTGRRGTCVVAASWGVGTAIVSGDADADTYHVDRDEKIVLRQIAEKRTAHRRGPDGVREQPVATDLVSLPALSDSQIVDVARLARATERHFGRPQDIEWALAGGQLYLLQSRPITSLAAMADPDGELAVHDNSNIAESFGGVTTPLTYSFARYVYEAVYREFCRILQVPEERIEANGDALRAMLGLVRGRVYYNLVSWYRILALLPGYQINRPFMEQMMGVKEGLPDEVAARLTPPSRRERMRDGVAIARMVFALRCAHQTLPASIAEFRVRLDTSLGQGKDLSRLRPDELVAHYRDLERALLSRWDAPLVNDFLAMIFYGALRKLATSWCGDVNGTLQNDLVSGGGDVISAEPARRIVHMAAMAEGRPDLVAVLCDGDAAAVRAALATHTALQREFDDYLALFADRCLEELKLETLTLGDDPMLLARSIGRLARAREGTLDGLSVAERVDFDFRGDAERGAMQRLRRRPLRRSVFRWVLRHARSRVRDRENLRFERTRVFGRVRRIFVELGNRYAALGALDNPRDIFYLTVDEALGWTGGTTPSADLKGIAAVRVAEFERYRQAPAPPDRFQTRGTVHAGHDFSAMNVPAADEGLSSGEAGGDTRRGIGCYPGVVKGIVRVVRDPRAAVLEPGEILVAERTDPGWVMLFPSASGLLVERGSLLSHSAIVARELGLPAVVSVTGLTAWLETGDVVEFDGRTGAIVRLERRSPVT